LRHVDALFAEKVLGHTLHEVDCPLMNTTDYWPNLAWYVGEGMATEQFLPKYHQSLDAAWPGVEKIINYGLNWSVWISFHANGHRVKVREGMIDRFEAHEPTPALAIVKACLLSMGVTEQEIKEAEVA